MKLLIVEDEVNILKALKKGFTKLGYAVDTAEDGEQALELFYSNMYDLVVLDLNLPRMDGIEVLAEIRREDKTIHIIILSARAEVKDKIVGLDVGANDYLSKPFHFAELEARIRALLRRKFETTDTVIVCSDVKIDTATKKVFVKENAINLSRKEYAILEYLMMNKGRIVSNEELIEHIWESQADTYTNAFKVHIHGLRKKLPVNLIRNLRGEGYYVE
ncbi:response regulator transcription factor [Paenibacillus thiaminolyticus]|uniref:DNA-binding response regulator n=1 Tax=Paenibacillus thiaminolyticus TaxID=49283 RepID=A0A3A3GPN7_PANTH|nr:response regulator transcription factor [Paenibacillus thiaminolyticus]RJG26531.1 DNA-binding response regulator [Paenibacillus thiaminolyticus]